MAREKAYRKYQLTFNNPQEHGFTHTVLRERISTMVGCIYWCMADEIGENGTYHTHLYLAFRNPVMFGTLQQRFYGAHIEGAQGSHQQNRDYIRKEGKWLDDAKHDTQVPETFEESGELPDERSARKKQSEVIFEMITAGATNAEILREYPSAMNSLQHIDNARQILAEEKHRDGFRPLKITYVWGKTGVGKTRSIMERYGYTNVYRVTNYAHPFDGYQGQLVILFDEFRSSLPFSDMLVYLEGYPTKLPARFRDKEACYEVVYVVSNIPMVEQYPHIQQKEPESWQAWLRRFDAVYEQVADMPPAVFQKEEGADHV